MRSTRTYLGVLLVAGTLAAGCGSSSHSYPQSVRHNFLTACRGTGGSGDRCQCVIDWFQAHVSYDKFKLLDAEVRLGKRPVVLAKAIAACE